MATITINVPDGIKTRVNDALCAAGGYTGPETKDEFVQGYIATWIKNLVVAQESRAAADSARESKLTEAKASITVG